MKNDDMAPGAAGSAEDLICAKHIHSAEDAELPPVPQSISLLPTKPILPSKSPPKKLQSSSSETSPYMTTSSHDEKQGFSETSSSTLGPPPFPQNEIYEEDDGYLAEDFEPGRRKGRRSSVAVTSARQDCQPTSFLRSRSATLEHHKTTSLSSDDDAPYVSVIFSERRRMLRQQRAQSQKRSRRRLKREPSGVVQDSNVYGKILRLAGSKLFPKIMLLIGLVCVSLTVVTGRLVFLSSELDELEHPTHITIMFRDAEMEDEQQLKVPSIEDEDRRPIHQFAAGLRGHVVHDVVEEMKTHPTNSDLETERQNEIAVNPIERSSSHRHSTLSSQHHDLANSHHRHHHHHASKKRHDTVSDAIPVASQEIISYSSGVGHVALPSSPLEGVVRNLSDHDGLLYTFDLTSGKLIDESQRRSVFSYSVYDQRHREIELHPSVFSDNTQLYGVLDSGDERINTMEIRQPLADGECVPMQEWQTTFHPSCNDMHGMDMSSLGESSGDRFTLFGTKGFWRNAWRVDSRAGDGGGDHDGDTVALKTLKILHRFEEAHFEHDRVDAVAMERLTSSPHVINIFGFCGHSVVTEYADGKRLGELADKSRHTPLARLRIARNIAEGLADMHGIDGDGNATFVHLDVNPANVMSIGGTLKLNDFNIGILRRWNTTSQTPCGFPAQYPNPQWRSPEEARNEQHLTEKVDVFSLGHILFRLICGHEPWHKLEPGGRPSKEEMTAKVINGALPFIPEEVMNSEEEEVIAIREAMFACYTYDPVTRPSARDITMKLQSALEALEAKSDVQTS